MNSWGNEHYAVPNMMGMGGMVPNMIPGMAPPFNMIGDMNQMAPPMNQMGQPISLPVGNPQPVAIVGPVQPDTQSTDSQSVPTVTESNTHGVQGREEHGITQSTRDRKDRRERERERERGRRHSRSRNCEREQNKDRNSRHDRADRNRSDQRERQSKWDHNDRLNQCQHTSSAVMPSNLMHYGNIMPNHMMSQQMEMTNMQPMMQIPGMMPNMMMMNIHMFNQPIYLTSGIILPPMPGVSIPARRECPPGCRTIFVGGLPAGITEDVVTEIFQRFGAIEEVKLHNGICHVRFEKPESIEQAFSVSGCRLKGHNQSDSEALMLYIDYAVTREDQIEYEKKRKRDVTPPRVEPYTQATFSAVSEKIKGDSDFAEAATTLAAWLERGECNKKNANTFYSLIQASNNQLRRLFNEKMQIDEEFQSMKNTMKEKFAHILLQFEQVAKILTAAKHQRVSDHFSKQQRRNIEMWLKMTEELENIKEEFNATFDDDEVEKGSKNVVSLEKYEQLRSENEKLTYELEGYKNEAHLAKEEAERKFEKFKAHFIAQQALQNKQAYPPLPSPPMPAKLGMDFSAGKQKPTTQPTQSDNVATTSSSPISASDAKLISILSAFLMVHPRGASLDYLVSYVKSMLPTTTQTAVHDVLNKYNDIFCRKTTGVGACIEHKWCFVFFDSVRI